MTKPRPSPPDVRYRLTPVGRAALENHERCTCIAKLAGMFVQCPDCGTVFGHVKDMFRPVSNRYRKNGSHP